MPRLTTTFLALGCLLVLRPAVGRAATDGAGAPSCIEGGGCSLQDLRTPTSPAFILIGVSPTLVERPTTPQDVAVTLYNAVQASGGLPRDFALEIAPYWLFQHPTLKYDAYTNASVPWQLAYNATLSLATVNGIDMGTTTGFTDLSVGLRTQFFISLASTDQKKAIADAETALAELQKATAFKIRLEHVEADIARLKCDENPATAGCPDLLSLRTQLKARQTTIDKQLSDGAKALQDADSARNGITVSFAGAASGRTLDGEKVSWHQPTKEGVWLDGGYRRPSFDVYGVGRYIHVDQGGSIGFFDAGARLDWIEKRFGLSAEYLYRWVVNQPATSMIAGSTRLTGTLEIVLTEGVFLTATVGQDVANESHPANAITLLGVSFQASHDRKLTLPSQ